MSPKFMVWVSVLLSAVAQVFLKHGLNRVTGRNHGTLRHPAALPLAVLGEPWVWLWGVSFVVATALWLLGVQHLDLSYAFPLLSAGYILVNLLSLLFFRERVDGLRWAAVAIISLGVVLIAAS
jgi:undecaprenyl phosphate-alpha-L-ara4N flippase subunit ArnE